MMGFTGGRGGAGPGSRIYDKIDTYFAALNKAFHDYDGKQVANLLGFGFISRKLAHDLSVMDNLTGVVQRLLRQQQSVNRTALVTAHLASVGAVYEGRLSQALDFHLDYFSVLSEMYKDEGEDPDMLLHLLRKGSKDLRVLALRADKVQKGVDPAVNKAVSALMAQFRVHGAAKGAMAHRDAALVLSNELFSCYLTINNTRLCKPITDWADKVAKLTQEDFASATTEFAQADAVTYHFYRARLLLLETDYKGADTYLTYAFRHCDPRAERNQRTILSFLIPVKLNLGRLPRPGLLQKYHLVEFEKLVRAFQEGNFKLYQEELDRYRDEFIARGVYLILERLVLVVYRNFFKKIYLLGGRETKLSLVTIHAVMMGLDPGSDVDLDELECILMNLIAKGYARGYISHERRMVVLSGTNPFPPTTADRA